MANNLHKALISTLIERRKELGLSHARLANLAGVHRTAISHIESGKRNPTLLTCLKLAEALNTSLAELLQVAESREAIGDTT